MSKVAQPELVSSIPGVAHLSKFFKTTETLPTITLIGRDYRQAQHQQNASLSVDKRPLVSETPFGWALMSGPHGFMQIASGAIFFPQRLLHRRSLWIRG